ncbi:SDR family NAD(P)-dependent oxidoreductase [Actinopolymorpha pittospori]
MGQLDGKAAVVTGGSSGLGAATAERLASEGATVFLTGRRDAELESVVSDINAQNVDGEAVAVLCDVAQLDDLDRLYDRVRERSGRVDVVFANAGVGRTAPLGEISEEDVDWMFGINLKGTVFTVQKALPLMPDGASVILCSSINASKGFAAMTIYSATKAAIRNFARTWAAELAGRRIRVNALSPGPIETVGLRRLVGGPEQWAEYNATVVASIPLGRLGQPKEVAAAVLFLASDESSFITGTELFVDGGIAQV